MQRGAQAEDPRIDLDRVDALGALVQSDRDVVTGAGTDDEHAARRPRQPPIRRVIPVASEAREARAHVGVPLHRHRVLVERAIREHGHGGAVGPPLGRQRIVGAVDVGAIVQTAEDDADHGAHAHDRP